MAPNGKRRGRDGTLVWSMSLPRGVAFAVALASSTAGVSRAATTSASTFAPGKPVLTTVRRSRNDDRSVELSVWPMDQSSTAVRGLISTAFASVAAVFGANVSSTWPYADTRDARVANQQLSMPTPHITSLRPPDLAFAYKE